MIRGMEFCFTGVITSTKLAEKQKSEDAEKK